MYWLGYDPQLVKADEIGARAHFFKTNRHTADHFVGQMRTTLESISQVLAPAGYVAFVVGRSKIHGEIVDNAQIIEDVGAAIGFKVEYRAERNIASTRKSFNLSHANIKTETVLVLTR
jgi:site-specific DNA-methyltransferase (cytosine-N4-specific)